MDTELSKTITQKIDVTKGTHHVDKAQDLMKSKGERDCDYDKGNISVVIWDTGIS